MVEIAPVSWPPLFRSRGTALLKLAAWGLVYSTAALRDTWGVWVVMLYCVNESLMVVAGKKDGCEKGILTL